MNNKKIALSYLNKGLSVIPLWSPELLNTNPPKYYVDNLKKKLVENAQLPVPQPDEEIIEKAMINQGKVPLIAWKEYQSIPPTEVEVREWFDKWPSANIAIVTGKISNLVVFDLDSENAVDYAKQQGGFPKTVKVKTGKGYHLYMKHPGFEIRNSVNKRLDIDIRADGGYVAAPPSIHGSGRHYEWEESLSIFETIPAPCESWMTDYLKSITDKTKTGIKGKGDLKTPQDPPGTRKVVAEDEYAELLKNGCTEGMRNDSATKLAGHLFAKKISESEVWEILSLWNTKNEPAINYSELQRTFDSVKKLESKNEHKKIDVASFLDNSKKVITEHEESYIKIPFAGHNLSQLETRMNGGLIGGRFYLLGGIPSACKTMLVNNLADNICATDQSVLVFSYDDGKTELRYRTFARFSSYTIEDFNQKKLNKDAIRQICLNAIIDKIMKFKFVVQENIPIEKWGHLIDQIQKLHGKPPVIMIDYLRKLRTENSTSDERLRVDDILSNLTSLAKKYNIPVLAISELARDSYKSGQRLSMASFKESGTIEYEASWLGILAAVEEKNGGYNLKNDWEKIIEHDGNVDLIVFKAKRGTGITGKIPLKVNRNKMTVKDREEHIFADAADSITRPSIFGARGN